MPHELRLTAQYFAGSHNRMSVPIAKGVTAATDLDRVRSSSSERTSETADAPAPAVAPARPRWRRWLTWLNPIRKRVCPYPGHESFVNAPWLVALGWLIFAVITVAKCASRASPIVPLTPPQRLCDRRARARRFVIGTSVHDNAMLHA